MRRKQSLVKCAGHEAIDIASLRCKEKLRHVHYGGRRESSLFMSISRFNQWRRFKSPFVPMEGNLVCLSSCYAKVGYRDTQCDALTERQIDRIGKLF